VFTFNHAANGQLTSLRMPGNVVDSMRYDLEGRMTWREERSPAHLNAPLQHETFVYDARGKVLQVSVPATVQRNSSSTFTQWYSGLGSLVMTNWVNSDNPQWQRERFTMDALGNMVARHEYLNNAEGPGNDHPDFNYVMDSGYGRVKQITRVDPQGYSSGAVDDTWLRYDMSGNQETSYQRSGPGGGAGFTHMVDTRSFYAADDRLRAFQKYDDKPGSIQGTSLGVFEEYRYDPLGRRVAVRTRRPPALCNQPAECYNSMTYFVWAGDQLLWEIRSTDAYDNEHAGGVVSYFQAGGIDRPLTIWKSGVGSVVTHQSWRGQFARGTFGMGASRPAGQSTECEESPPTNGCLPIQWPGWNTSAWSQEAAKPHTTGSDRFWFGSLSVGMRDASGQQYMRNRYYNPQTGQFTQPDPIGLAGGLNSYGFAAGDPVSYSDPLGLYIRCVTRSACEIWARVYDQAVIASRSSNRQRREHAQVVLSGMQRIMNSREMVALTARNRNPLRRGVDWAFPKWFPVTGSGPCERIDRYCPSASGYGVVIDPGWAKFKGVGEETRFVHELGHILSYLDGKDGPEDNAENDQDAVDFEDHYRAMSGCGLRSNHTWSGGRCEE
jgi:RHS repeat-associated protein